MRPYLAMFSARFRLLLQYRAAAAAGVGTQLFWGLIRMMIFQAFYENASPAALPMSAEQTTAYVWLGQAFLMLLPFRADGELAAMIRSGDVAYELLRPINLYAFWYARGLASRAAPTLLRCLPILILAVLAGWLDWPGPAALAAFAAALVGAVLLAAAWSMLMTISLFWTLAGDGINRVSVGMQFLLTGMIVPLPLMPDAMRAVLAALPFAGIIDIPFRLFIGLLPPSALSGALAHQAMWTAGLIALGAALLGRARRRLVVQGG